ncbi:hypothetical protein ACTQ34_06960 [Agathobaculum sp. LCP25S3_E8]|uniref:hypothetical protein n=1 Tax=Agathobaculum sp. LCP25S3_E8 TaxID=3438735 RepID=UPI003F921E1B
MDFLRRFMAGRYGSDQLNNALLLLGLVLIVVEWISRWRWVGIFVLALLILCYFRMFSRNIQARYAENQWFLRRWGPVSNRLRNMLARFRDRKTHRYFKCPQCKQRLRVPRGRGKINITCPHCHHQFIRKS